MSQQPASSGSLSLSLATMIHLTLLPPSVLVVSLPSIAITKTQDDEWSNTQSGRWSSENRSAFRFPSQEVSLWGRRSRAADQRRSILSLLSSSEWKGTLIGTRLCPSSSFRRRLPFDSLPSSLVVPLTHTLLSLAFATLFSSSSSRSLDSLSQPSSWCDDG